MSTPSEILSRAADLIRDTAAAASPGDWSAMDMAPNGHQGVWWVDCTHRDDEGTTWSTVADLSAVGAAADARWIALLSPAVAPHLEATFRAMVAAAAHQAEAIPRTSARIYPKGFHAVLALARAVLGEVMPEVDRG